MRRPRLSEPEARLLQPPEPARFSAAELEGLPEPVQRHLAQAIAPRTPLATSARLRMRGHIKVGRWLPFRARQILSPHLGFAWAARAAGVIAGSDRYLDGVGVTDWKLAGLVTVVHAEGPDVARSAAGRAGAEAIWLPTALLPHFGVRWSAGPGDQVTADFRVGDFPMELQLRLDAAAGTVCPAYTPATAKTSTSSPATPTARFGGVTAPTHPGSGCACKAATWTALPPPAATVRPSPPACAGIWPATPRRPRPSRSGWRPTARSWPAAHWSWSPSTLIGASSARAAAKDLPRQSSSC